MTAEIPLSYPMGQRLPPALRPGKQLFVTRYKDYPVFGWPWWWRRMLFFLPFAIVIFFLPTYESWLPLSSRVAAAEVAFLTMSAFLVMVGLGPGVAGVLRHRRLPARWEGPALIVTIVVCIGIGLLANKGFQDACDWILASYPQAKAKSLAVNIDKAKSLSSASNLLIVVVVFGLSGGGLALSAYYRELRLWHDFRTARLEAMLGAQKQEANLRLSVLQAQVEPHFLFNTLASVRALVRADPAQSEATLDALVAYLRASIPKLRSEAISTESTLGQQLDLCASYLEVMRIRTAGRLQHAVEVDASLRDAAFPPMLLITLVENAIKHGIEPKPGPGRVTISATRDGDVLHVVVDDDGVGLQPGIGGGLGLANVRAQLDALYGKRAGFDLRSRGTGGVRAELRLPMAHAA